MELSFSLVFFFFFFNDTATTEIYTLSLHDALPICAGAHRPLPGRPRQRCRSAGAARGAARPLAHGDGRGGRRADRGASRRRRDTRLPPAPEPLGRRDGRARRRSAVAGSGASFAMIARREADDGRREARTQGAPISKWIWVRPRPQHRGAQRRIAAWPLIGKG